MTTEHPPELSRRIPVDRIGRQGLTVEVEARPEELAPLARRLNVPAVASLRCRFELGAVHGGTIDAQGELEAHTTRICVASLEPFEEVTRERFALRFVPEGELAEDDDIDAVDEIGYGGSQIDLGEAAVEQLGLALDPYPRRPGVVLDGVDSIDSAPIDADDAEADGARPNPFAVLARRGEPG